MDTRVHTGTLTLGCNFSGTLRNAGFGLFEAGYGLNTDIEHAGGAPHCLQSFPRVLLDCASWQARLLWECC